MGPPSIGINGKSTVHVWPSQVTFGEQAVWHPVAPQCMYVIALKVQLCFKKISLLEIDIILMSKFTF